MVVVLSDEEYEKLSELYQHTLKLVRTMDKAIGTMEMFSMNVEALPKIEEFKKMR